MAIGLGTAAIGRPQYINIRSAKKQGDFEIEAFSMQGKSVLTTAYQRGIRHFDTAPGYGMAEQILLEWIKEYKPSDITVSTKWGYTYVANFDPKAIVHEVKEHSLQKLEEQWAFSNQFLPYLTIYQIHSATLDSGVLENDQVLNKLFEIKQQHKIVIGLSTSGANQNEIINKALGIQKGNLGLFDSFQVTYNIFDQNLVALSEELNRQKKQIIIKEALANGRVFPNNNFNHYRKNYEAITSLAKKYNVGVDAIAIRFCIDSFQPHKVLSGAVEASHLDANLKALTFQLTASELDELKAIAISPFVYWEERKKLLWN